MFAPCTSGAPGRGSSGPPSGPPHGPGLPRRRLLLRAGRGRPSEGGQRRAAVRRLVATMAVLLETTLGDIVIDLYTEERPRGRSAAGRGRGSWEAPNKRAGGAAGGACSRARTDGARLGEEVPGCGRRCGPAGKRTRGRLPWLLPSCPGFSAARGRSRGRWAAPHPTPCRPLGSPQPRLVARRARPSGCRDLGLQLPAPPPEGFKAGSALPPARCSVATGRAPVLGLEPGGCRPFCRRSPPRVQPVWGCV